MQQGQNPYEPTGMREIQLAINPAWTEPMMMWNPPWIFLILAPFLKFSFLISAKIHFALSIFAILASALIGGYVYRNSLLASVASFTAISLVPIYYCLELGQMGCYIAFFTSLVLLGLKNLEEKHKLKSKDYLFELPLYLGIVGCLIKPHLFLFLFAAISMQQIYKKNYYFFLKLIVSFFVITAFTEIAFPHQMSYWLSAMHSPPKGVISPWGWYVPTLVGVMRYLLDERLSLPYLLFPIIIPFTAICLFYLNRGYKKSLVKVFPNILIISYFVSPFGWIFDFCGAGLLTKKRYIYLLIIPIFNILFFYVIKDFLRVHLGLFYYLISLLFLITIKYEKD